MLLLLLLLLLLFFDVERNLLLVEVRDLRFDERGSFRMDSKGRGIRIVSFF